MVGAAAILAVVRVLALATCALLSACGDAALPGLATDEQRTRVALTGIESAVAIYVAERGSPPASLDLLVSTHVQGEPYLSRLPLDAWGTPFALELRPDGGWTVRSAGRDRAVGTSDDLTVGGRPGQER